MEINFNLAVDSDSNKNELITETIQCCGTESMSPPWMSTSGKPHSIESTALSSLSKPLLTIVSLSRRSVPFTSQGSRFRARMDKLTARDTRFIPNNISVVNMTCQRQITASKTCTPHFPSCLASKLHICPPAPTPNPRPQHCLFDVTLVCSGRRQLSYTRCHQLE